MHHVAKLRLKRRCLTLGLDASCAFRAQFTNQFEPRISFRRLRCVAHLAPDLLQLNTQEAPTSVQHPGDAHDTIPLAIDLPLLRSGGLPLAAVMQGVGLLCKKAWPTATVNNEGAKSTAIWGNPECKGDARSGR